MAERETSKAIAEAAAEWVARIDRSGGDRVIDAELEAWLAGDTRRQGAYFRAQSAWAMLDRASVLAGGVPEAEQQGDEEAPSLLASRRRFIWGGGAIAASLIGGLAGLNLLKSAPTERIETAIGEIRRVDLADGSTAAINTGSKLAINLQHDVRQVSIDRGEAWFHVAKDKARPFVVESGDVRVRAVGTAFSVRRTETGTEVRVTEGVVEVWCVTDPADVRRVSAGSRTFVNSATIEKPVADTNVERGLSWRTGQLVFDGDTLGEAAAEFNRYNRVQVRITDPELASQTFVGRFRTNEPDAFARAAATILDARVSVTADEIVLSRK